MIKFAPLFTLCAYSILQSQVFAMDLLDDTEMSHTTGQDGITIGLELGSNGAITFDHVVIEDRDGIAGSSYQNPAGIAYITQGAGKGISFHSTSSVITKPLEIVIDADGNNNLPVMNIGVMFAPNLKTIRLDAFSIGLVKMGSNMSINPITRRDILKTGTSGIDINLRSGSRLGVNLQLGNQPQNALFKLTGSLESITAKEPIEILSYSGCVLNAPCNSNSSLKFGFELKANEASTQGVRLNNVYGLVDNSGLVFGNTGTLDAFDLKLSDITFGSKTATPDASIFNGLSNGSIGNIGAEGIKVTDLKMSIRGL